MGKVGSQKTEEIPLGMADIITTEIVRVYDTEGVYLTICYKMFHAYGIVNYNPQFDY